MRVRVTVTFTHHLAGEPRSSMNDRLVGKRDRYDAFFEAIQKALQG